MRRREPGHAGVRARRRAPRPRLRRTSPSAVALSSGGMTVTGDPVRLGDDQHPGAPATASPRPVPDPVARRLPVPRRRRRLWQSAHAIREHRCGAVEPAVPLTLAKQRQLCLVGAHRTCATYLAAQERATTTGNARARARDGEPTLWPATRSTLLVLEPERRLFGLSGSRTRVGGQAAPDRADGRRVPAADRRAHVVAVDPGRGGRRVGLGTRGRVADAAGHAVARGIAHGVRRPVRDASRRRRSRRPDPTASATR